MSAYWQMVADIYGRRAEQHRPVDKDAMRVAVVELRQRGLTAGDISSALRISVEAVHELLREAP